MRRFFHIIELSHFFIIQWLMIGVGIDFGTSNSAAAWYDGEKVHLAKLETAEHIMPTATHLDRDLSVTTGQAAVDQYIDENEFWSLINESSKI